MDILVETTRSSSRTNKDQRGYLFRTDEKKVEKEALKWDYFVLKEELKSLMYVNRSLRGDPRKDKLMDKLNFKNCMRFKRKTTSVFFVGITVKRRKFIIHPRYFDANNIFSRQFIQNLKHRSNVFQYLSTTMKKAILK